MLTPAPKPATARRFRFIALALAALFSTSLAASDVKALPPLRLDAVIAGACAVVGTVTETFSPAVGNGLSTVKAYFTGTGTCEGSGLGDTIYVNLTTNALLTCAGGEGTLAGNISFLSGFPPMTGVSGLYFGAPGSAAFEVTGPGPLAVTGALAWSPTATAACPLSGTLTTPLYGTVVYAFE